MQKKGFTLAEALITLGIIGVVAAITIPVLINNYKVKITQTKLKKANSILNQAYLNAYNNNGDPTNWRLADNASGATNIYEYFIKDNIKTTKNCGTSANGCFKKAEPTRIGGSKWGNAEADTRHYKIITSDGISMSFRGHRPLCDGVEASNNLSVCGLVYVDVDGPNKGKHAWGNDLFQFFITKDKGVVPSGGPGTYSGDSRNSISEVVGYGHGATWWVINMGNMDYLKCPEKLNYTDKTTCK